MTLRRHILNDTSGLVFETRCDSLEERMRDARRNRGRAAVLATAALALALVPTSGARAQTVDDLAWIAGQWVGEAFGGSVEEGWFAPAGGSLSGSFRLVQNDVAVMYELLLIEQDADGVYYRFKHVGRGWEPLEEEPLEYRLTGLEGRKATFRPTFEEPVRNAPAWFTYESPSDDLLIVTIHGGQSPIIIEMRRF